MYGDKSLTPAEVIRLAVLGGLTEGDVQYAALATNVRHFVERMVGPSLDLLGSSLEVLRLEGLIEPVDGQAGDDALMRLTAPGRNLFEQLMVATLRTPMNDIQRLVLALKLRYLPQHPTEDQADQIDMLLEQTEIELARLEDLRTTNGTPIFEEWLDHEISHMASRKAWLHSALESLEENV